MAMYEKFPRDFIKRTKEDIEAYSGQYNVTNLINSCLGLIVIPTEKYANIPNNYIFNEYSCDYGVTKSNFKIRERKNNNEKYNIINIIKHIRNGLAHNKIKFTTNGNTILKICIYDRRYDKGKEKNINLIFIATVEEFKTFALRVADDFLELEEQKAN